MAFQNNFVNPEGVPLLLVEQFTVHKQQKGLLISFDIFGSESETAIFEHTF
ncbi:hypothetical protein SAMN05421736_103214 [Evansella caseinilytica]|uniref:Uncharacterized protein n=1 Tax=Evansella caseinilytica TaxID=1503961 RepID=A0A1H3MF71_9BACI|nr:hypothetical protein SAMN05421736_103214 [Evansella caseinilytica]